MTDQTTQDANQTPAAETGTVAVTPSFDKTVDTKEMKFRWNKDDTGYQRPSIVLPAAPVPSVEGFVEILTKGGKGLVLLQEAAYDVVRAAIASYLADTENATAENIPWEKFSWEAIANQTKEERAKIAPETWKAFAADYIAKMPALTGKTVENVTNATLVFLKKYSIIKSDKPVIKMLQDQLTIYATNSKEAENFSEIIQLLSQKAKLYLEANDVAQLVANL